MEIWFTADLHLGHKNIIELCGRPFADVDEMNTALIERWNSVVAPKDRVYVLGDVAMGKIADTLPLAALLNGQKMLVPGNHDRCWQGNNKIRAQDIAMYEQAGFTILDSQVAYGQWLLCHFPATGDSHLVDRYAEHRPSLSGRQGIVHGHVHNTWKVNDRQVNVGVDMWNFHPAHVDQVAAALSSC